MIKSWLNLGLAVLTAGTFYGQQAVQGGLISQEPTPGPDALSGSYSIVVQPFDWGAAVTQARVTFEEPLTSVTAEQFLVVEEKQTQSQGEPTIARTIRTVTDAYLCDAQGELVDEPSQFVTLELEVSPTVGNPLSPSAENHSQWAEPYHLVIELTEDSTLSTAKTRYAELSVSRVPTARETPFLEPFTTGTYGGLQYASYAPPSDGEKKPLVVWLHGLGEGGSDPLLPLLGNNASVFAEETFQVMTGGAYVLVPQCPTFWLDDGSGQATQTGRSRYTQDLMSLFRCYLAEHPNVDTDRIYVGGCSNGGYMTIELLLSNPEFFAAAFPICPAYQDRWVTDEGVTALAKLPIWFIHSELDQVVPPDRTTAPLVKRLEAAGANQVHTTWLTHIRDSASGHTYDPHYAWVPVLSQRIYTANQQSLFSWLAAQSK